MSKLMHAIIRNKKKIEAIFILLICCTVFLLSCGSKQTVKPTDSIPPFKITKTTLAKNIKESGSEGIPVNPSSIFSIRDTYVVSHIKYANLHGKHNLKWEWYNPEGELYQSTGKYEIKSNQNSWYKKGSASHKISVSGTKAADYPGTWTVRIYLDEALVITESFQIVYPYIPVSDSKAPDYNFGNYHALVVGNKDYKYLYDLNSSENDAKDVAAILKEKYGFSVTLLIDATRSEFILSLNEYRRRLTEKDNFLVYYAGHGWLDESADEGYWLPVDASFDNPLHYISNSTVTSAIKAMRAKHILVVADSCYSGKITRDIHIRPYKAEDYIMRMAEKKARTVLSSGGLEPVTDSGGKGGHSVFASAFLDILEDNEDVLDCTELFFRLRRMVILGADQTPEYSDIRKAGHEGGDFLFVRKK